MPNGNINDLELAKFIELAGEYGIRVHLLHGDSWLPSVASFATLPAIGNATGDIRQTIDTGTPYRWNGTVWAQWMGTISWGSIVGILADQTDIQAALNLKQDTSGKDTTGGYVGLTLFKINFKNVANTITSFFTNSNTVARTYTFQNRDGTIADNTDLALKANLANPTFTGNVAVPTPSLGTDAVTKAYADALVTGLLDYRGAYNASVNTFPATGGSGIAGAVLKGDMWVISVAGTLGGTAVQIGDSLIANVDTPAQTTGNWNILNSNISYVPEDVANKSTSITTDIASNTKYPSVKSVYDWATGLFATITNLALKAPIDSPTFTGTVGGINAAMVGAATSTQGTTADNALPKAGGVMTGKTTVQGVDTVGATYAPGTGNQTVAINCLTNNMHIVSGNASGTAITFTVANATNNQPFIISILQGGTTVSTITAWFATVRWAGGVEPTLTATLNKRDTFGFIRTGVNTYDGFIIGQNC